MALNLNRDVLRHGSERNQPESAAMVLSLRHRDFPRPSRHVLDLVPHQSGSDRRVPVGIRGLQALLQWHQ